MGSTKPQEELLESLPRTIRHQERQIKKLRKRPSGLRKRDAREQELLDTNIRVLEFLKKRFAKPS
jgi:hypothetical protein